MAKIFISYRRRDSAYIAAVLSEKLQECFGQDSVFFDVDKIPLGVDFRDWIGNAVGQCSVLLAIIGDEWVDVRDDQGNKRLDKPTDHVRVEIESALKRAIPVVPVLVDKAVMPSPDDLPASLQAIAFRNAAELRAGRDFRQHLDRLVRGLEEVVQLTRDAAERAAVKAAPVKVVPVNAASAAPMKAAPVKAAPPVKGFSPVAATAAPPVKASSPVAATAAPRAASEGILKTIKDSLEDYTNGSLFVGTIPGNKASNAVNAFAVGVLPQDVLLLYDNTVFGGAKDGLLLTAEAVYWRNMAEKPRSLPYKEIKEVVVRPKQGFFESATLLINNEMFKISMGNQLAETLLRVIRRLASC